LIGGMAGQAQHFALLAGLRNEIGATKNASSHGLWSVGGLEINRPGDCRHRLFQNIPANTQDQLQLAKAVARKEVLEIVPADQSIMSMT